MILEELRIPQRVNKFPCFQKTRYFIVLFVRTRHHFLQYLSGESNTVAVFYVSYFSFLCLIVSTLDFIK